MKLSSYILILLISSLGFAQDWQLVKTIELKEDIASVSVDPEGRIYLGSGMGNLHRLSPAGEKGDYFSDVASSEITLVEAWNKFKVFLFLRDQQKFSFLNRFTTKPVNYELSDHHLGYAWLATPGIDNSIWVLSTDYNELRKYDIQTKQQLISTPLPIAVSQAAHMRAYQNLLIISDQDRGLLFFDQYGSLLRKIDMQGVEYFQIDKGNIIFLAEGHVHTLDPFKFSIEEKIKAPEGAFGKVIVSGNDHYFIARDKILIYQRAHEPR